MQEGEAPREVTLLRLRVFVAVVEHGGFTAAARHLGLGQSTVSFHVRELERSFGTRLLGYHGRRVVPTATGETVHGGALRVLGDVRDLAERVASAREGRSGRVRLGASMAFEQPFFLDRVVVPYRRARPDVDLSVRFGTSRAMTGAAASGEVDLAYVMRWHPALPPEVHYTPLHASRVVLLVAEDHPLATGPDPTPEDIAASGLVTAPLDAVEWEYYDRALEGIGLRGYRVALEVTGIQARILAARAGLGVVPVFWPPFARDPAPQGLVALALTGGAGSGPEFGLVERGGSGTAAQVRAFGRWLREAVST